MLQIRIICYFHFDRFSINEFSKKKKEKKISNVILFQVVDSTRHVAISNVR